MRAWTGMVCRCCMGDGGGCKADGQSWRCFAVCLNGDWSGAVKWRLRTDERSLDHSHIGNHRCTTSPHRIDQLRANVDRLAHRKAAQD